MKTGEKMIFVLSASAKKDKNNNWISTSMEREDFFLGAPGGRLRVAAAAYLYKHNPDYFIITSGGRGWDIKNDEADRPVLSEIMKRELLTFGVPRGKIFKEDNSNKTYGQLMELKKIILQFKPKEVIIISNDYHLPRVQAMLETDKILSKILADEKIKLLSAEEVCLKYEPNKWKNIIKNAYKNKKMQDIIKLEKKGVGDIKAGRYKFNKM